MVTADINVENARIVTPSGIVQGGIAVADGRILKIGNNDSLPDADKIVDAERNYLIPGFIDVHNHMGLSEGYENDYHTQYELDMETETRACIKGGVTSFLPFLLQDEPYMPDMDFFIEAGEEQSYIDFGFHAIVHQDHHVEEIEQLADEAGIRSFKLFFNMYKVSAPELGIGHSDAGRIYNVFQKTSEIKDAVVMFHAENDDLLQERIREVRDEQERDSLKAWADQSPGIAQSMQVDQIGALCEETGGTAYVVHNSDKKTIPVFERYQQRGVNLYAETLPPFLANHCEDESVGLWGKISPPIKTKEDQKALWQALRSGTIQHVSTDHCPFPLDYKGPRDGSFWDSPPGHAGLQTFLPTMLHHGVNKNRLSIERVAETCATNNAKRFGLYPEKGALLEGADADMVIVDLGKEVTVDSDWLIGIADDWRSSYGKTLQGAPTHTFVNGELVVEDDEIIADKGIGQYLSRGPTGIEAE